jgi:ubiquinone/menaquinone biosynthesis C-methylase UbiE
MPLPDDGFDVVLCQMGLQFFQDKVAALREMRRTLAPGGRTSGAANGHRLPAQAEPVVVPVA